MTTSYQQDSYGFREEVLLIEETVEERRYRLEREKRRAWRRHLKELAAQLSAEGFQVEVVESNQHPMGCYLRTSKRPIQTAFDEAMADAYQRLAGAAV